MQEPDLIVCSANRLLQRRFQAHGFYTVPAWVRTFADLTIPPEEFFAGLNHTTAADIRRMETSDFQPEMTSDPRWHERFYREMYVPYVSGRFGELAICHSESHVRRMLDRGSLMLLKQGTKPVAGLALVPLDGVLHCPCMGIPDGSMGTIKQGASAALYYYAIRWAYSAGMKAVNFGHSRAFLSDGVLKYKLKWNMRVLDDDDAVSDLAVKPLTPAGRAFLNAHPFIHIEQGELRAYDPTDRRNAAEEMEQRISQSPAKNADSGLYKSARLCYNNATNRDGNPVQ